MLDRPITRFEIHVHTQYGDHYVPHIVHNDLHLARITADDALKLGNLDYRYADEVEVRVGEYIVARGRVSGKKIHW